MTRDEKEQVEESVGEFLSVIFLVIMLGIPLLMYVVGGGCCETGHGRVSAAELKGDRQ